MIQGGITGSQVRMALCTAHYFHNHTSRASYATLRCRIELLNLEHQSYQSFLFICMASEPHATLLRSLRKRSGLTQKDIAQILGFRSEITVSRHERSLSVPSLFAALSYEIIFSEAISMQLKSLHREVEAKIEQHLTELEHALQQCDGKGRDARIIAKKLVFLNERRINKSNPIMP